MKVEYTNWRGETGIRTIKPIRLWFGSTEYHPTPQWLLKAFDVDKGAERDFAVNDMRPCADDDGGGFPDPAKLHQHVRDLRGVLDNLVDTDPCWHDHHGYCQAHHLEAECSVKRARELLEEGKEFV